MRIAALLIARLRFERLVSASSDARERFVADPESFTELLGVYHRQVPAPSLDPWREARCFAQWLDSRDMVDDDPV